MKTKAGVGRSGSHNFASIPHVDLPRSTFNRSHGVTTTFDAANLIPIYIDEALPGDTIRLMPESFIRMATPLRPVIDDIFIDTFFFSVPVRLVWDNWKRFNGEQDNPGDSTDFTVPTITSPAGGYAFESIYDYLGIPPGVAGLEHSALPLRCLNLIFNEWFRDENLVDALPVPKDDGPDDPADYSLFKRGKRHDYFTSSLPWPQKGPAVQLPLGTTAPLGGAATGTVGATGVPTFDSPTVTNTPLRTALGTPSAVTINASSTVGDLDWNDPNLELTSLDISGLFADLSTATAATINDIRNAFQIQRVYERDARGGTRYTEQILSHWGVSSPDQRLQRPEYLGGGSRPINVHPVAATTRQMIPSLVPGDLGAFVTGAASPRGFVQSFTEHCYVFGLASVRATLRYQNGLHRLWSRRTRFDFALPAFSHLGEQEVLSKEIFADGSSADDDIWGYQERYGEYRYAQSMITGKFRSTDPQTLDIWHLAQDFGTRPVLNDAFITENPPMDRVIAVPSEPQFLGDWWFNIQHVRALPSYGVPGLIDHF